MMRYTLNDIQYLASVCNADSITCHWSAGRYDQSFYDYHLNILGDGSIVSNHDNFDVKLSHTWRRNTGNIGIALACCLDAGVTSTGEVNWGTYPPTDAQIETMAQVVAAICKGKDWEPTYDKVKTHAEWAAIDGYSIYDDDPDMRWDLIKVPQEDGEGGDVIRGKAAFYMGKI